MNMLSKMASSFKHQAAGCEEIIFNFKLRITRLNQRDKWPVACGLQLVALILLFLQHSANAQVSFPPVTINLNYPQYQRLKLDGGYEYVSGAGIQGVILYRLDEGTYIAYERKCSIGDDAPVSVDASGLYMNGCGSTYNFSDGYPTSGRSVQPLLKYRTSLTGQTLVITDEVAY
jgi:hypothetical protein